MSHSASTKKDPAARSAIAATKGPWTQAGHLIVGHRGSPVCELSPASYLAGSITEQAANARLIAAAPELLEALVMVELMMTQEPAHNAWDLGPDTTLLAVRAAIKKAKGQ